MPQLPSSIEMKSTPDVRRRTNQGESSRDDCQAGCFSIVPRLPRTSVASKLRPDFLTIPMAKISRTPRRDVSSANATRSRPMTDDVRSGRTKGTERLNREESRNRSGEFAEGETKSRWRDQKYPITVIGRDRKPVVRWKFVARIGRATADPRDDIGGRQYTWYRLQSHAAPSTMPSIDTLV